MSMTYTDIIESYLLNEKFSKKIFEKKSCCFKLSLEKEFGCTIDCAIYDQVVNGEGNEKDKIATTYSSSLQSLLFFCGVSENNPLKIKLREKEVIFTKVFFEYKNKVIGYPSSVDVVLVDTEEQNILFIESKLAEIVRDSQKNADDKVAGTKEVGISYLLKTKESGYFKALNLKDKEELKNLGIDIPEGMSYPVEKIIDSTERKIRIIPVDNNKYVYSYGIKQMLAHIIGIINFRTNKPGKNCSKELDSISKKANIYFMELWNEFPDIESHFKDAENNLEKVRMACEIRTILDEYRKHISKVESVLNDKIMGISLCHSTYQAIYREAGSEFDLAHNIVKYYHLDE